MVLVDKDGVLIISDATAKNFTSGVGSSDDAGMFNGFYLKMEYKELFRARRIPSLAESLAKRCQSFIAERHEKRKEFLWGAVVPEEVPAPSKAQEIENKANKRVEMLKKWKEEKIRKLEEAKKKQKPIFKVGVVQRKVTGSPLFSQQRTCAKNNLSCVVKNECLKKLPINDLKEKKAGVLTRARARKMNVKVKQVEEVVPTIKTEKKLKNELYKIDKNKKQKVNSLVFKVPEAVSKLPYSGLTFPYSPQLTRKSKVSLATKENQKQAEKVDLEEQPKENTVQEPKDNSPVGTESDQDDFRPIHYSPFVTVRSGKKSERKSQGKLIFDVDEQIKKEQQEFECRIFSFRKFIECETKRLLEICNKWKHVYEEFEEVPVDVEGDIDSVIGKTKLLTSDKFNQFRGLIDKCERGDPFVKVDDLQGFQDWVALEVERIDEEFHRMETRKAHGWQEPQLPQKPRGQNQPTKTAKTAKTAAKKPVGRSNIRAHILAARKLLKEGNTGGGEWPPQSPSHSFENSEKTKTPTRESSLLKKVLSAELKMRNEFSAKKSSVAREKRNSGLEIMIATQKNKFPTPAKKSPAASDFEVYFDEENTPTRSILKKTPKVCSASKGRVTFKSASRSGAGGRRGLSEKYFQPLMDSDENSPMRTIFGDLGNLGAGGVRTRSRTRLLSQSSLTSPQVK